VVGTVGFEPTTSSSRTMRAAKLRHVPKARKCIAPGESLHRRPSGPPCSAADHVGLLWDDAKVEDDTRAEFVGQQTVESIRRGCDA
jgi:hypothetical protein